VRQRSSKPKAPPSGSALDAGLRLLAGRAHSRAELKRKLARRGFDPEAVEAATVRLSDLGYLDDRAFAAGLTRRRSASRGPLAISAELAAKGVDRITAQTALGALTPEAQLEAATRLAERLCDAGPRLAYREMRDRIGAKLVRRGFSSAVAGAAARAVLEGTPDPPGA
jgi:regulatory protein